MTTKGQRRRERKLARAEGMVWDGSGSEVRQVPVRTPAEERKHWHRMQRWAEHYDELNGAAEGPDDF